jgi:hypothetical protein
MLTYLGQGKYSRVLERILSAKATAVATWQARQF